MQDSSFPNALRKVSIEKLESDLRVKPESFWNLRGERRAMKLFQEMAVRVPAYKDFLKKNKVKKENIKSIKDFINIPSVDKDNYLKAYPLKALCWDGKLSSKQFVYSATSGTTGEPFYFPRTEAQSEQYALTAELYLRSNFKIHERSTLYIDGFAMGAWIGGLFTYEAISIIARKGYPLSIITPGVNAREIIKAIKQLGSQYDQVILGGYPPFVKDVIDFGITEGLIWSDYKLGIIFSAEGFNEGFRDYISDRAGLKNIYTSSLNHYGTVDQGTHSHETPLSILVRRLTLENKEFCSKLFPQVNRQPTFTQYMPEQFYFDEVDGHLFCSAYSGLPLVRYDLKDRGGLFNFNEVLNNADSSGLDLPNHIKKAKIEETVWKLPFVYLYERSDMVVSWYGANIYPEHIRQAHLHKTFAKYVTGKFSMRIVHSKKFDPILEIHVELKNGVKPGNSLIRRFTSHIVKTLKIMNSEYKNNYYHAASKNTPKLKLWEHQSPPHFIIGGKQKWVIK